MIMPNFNHRLQRELEDSMAVLNFCIKNELPETAREVSRWMAAVGFEIDQTLRDKPKMSLWPKPYILSNYQENIR